MNAHVPAGEGKRSVGGKGHTVYSSAGLEDWHLLPFPQIPWPHRSVIPAGQAVTAVGREGNATDKVRMLESTQLLASLNVPQANAVVGLWRPINAVLGVTPATGKHLAGVGRKGHAVNEIFVSLKSAQFLA